MITIYATANGVLKQMDLPDGAELPPDTVWVDLLEPTPDEERRVERLLNIDAPTREEMQEIEASSRIYQEGDTRFMTATVAAKIDTGAPVSGAITFIRSPRALVTLRYVDPKPFQVFAARAMRLPGLAFNRDQALLGLLDALVDRAADVVEKMTMELDGISRAIFVERQGRTDEAGVDLEETLRSLGKIDDLISKVKDSMSSVGRIVTYLTQVASEEGASKDYKLRLKSLNRDALSLSEHTGFVAHKVNFLLDATLGLINIEQTAIIKIFSVAAVVFLPPTLIASIYGMNFHILPELSWDYGYLWALFLMAVSAVLPYWYFKRRRWL